MKKIFIDNKPLLLLRFNETAIKSQNGNFDHLFSSTLELKEAINRFTQSGKYHTMRIFYNNTPDRVKQSFQILFKPMTAAGGLVINPDNEFLFIFRKGKWDLPKGKPEKDESLDDCAIREVTEETGI